VYCVYGSDQKSNNGEMDRDGDGRCSIMMFFYNKHTMRKVCIITL
jgi:hypothetical protein